MRVAVAVGRLGVGCTGDDGECVCVLAVAHYARCVRRRACWSVATTVAIVARRERMERTGKTGSRAGGEVGQGSRGVSSEHEADMYVLPREYRGSIDSSRKSREWDRKEYILITPLTMTMTDNDNRRQTQSKSKIEAPLLNQRSTFNVQRLRCQLPGTRPPARYTSGDIRDIHTSRTLTYPLTYLILPNSTTQSPHHRIPVQLLSSIHHNPLLSSPLLAHSLPRVALTHCTTLFLSYIHPTRRDPRKSSRQTPITRVLSFPLPLWHTIIIPYHTLFVLSFRS